MGKTIGVQMIQMYEKMVQDDFGPLMSKLEARTEGIKDQVEIQVKKDMGVYGLYEEQAALNLRLKEIGEKISGVEKKRYVNGVYVSKIGEEVGRRLAILNAPLNEVRSAAGSMVRQIRLSGVGQDIKNVFEAMPDLLEEFTEKFGSLPEITEKEMMLLAAPKVKGKKKK